MRNSDEILNLFPEEKRPFWSQVVEKIEELQEIRLRVNQPIIILYRNGNYYLNQKGLLIREKEKATYLQDQDLEDIMNHICNYSMYAYEDQLKQGYLTVQGGHRVGVAGTVIMEGNTIKNIKYISYVNIRVSHQIIGAADKILPYIYQDRILQNTLIISPPGCGKTTLLRDMIRQISNGNKNGKGLKIGVVDERSELGGCFRGIAQNDLGIQTDILDGCPKVEGMMMLIRSMAPEVIAIDELGNQEDFMALEKIIKCGCHVIATIHGSTIEELALKSKFQFLLKNQLFQRYILLDNTHKVGNITEIYNEDMQECLK